MSKRSFDMISDLLDTSDFSVESFLLDLPIQCEDGQFFWSKFLLASSSKFLSDILVRNEDMALVLPHWKCSDVQQFLFNSVKRFEADQDDDIENLSMFQVLGFHAEQNTKPKDLVCSAAHCFKKFQRARDLHRHMASHSQEQRFICDQCGKVFFHLDNLNLHIKYHQDLQQVHHCSFCQEKFRGYRALQTHMDDHHSAPISCPVCGKLYKKRRLLRHMRAKHGEDSSSSRKKAGLLTNRRIRRLSASLTPTSKTTKDAIDELIECQNRRIKCTSCDQTFANRYIAKYHHQKVHLKLQKKGTILSCSVCEKKFIGPPSRLARHMREVHAENRFECSQCGHFFPVKSSLERHLMTVHHPQKLECPFCPVKVVHISAHLISTHGMSSTEARHVAADLTGQYAARTNIPYDKSD